MSGRGAPDPDCGPGARLSAVYRPSRSASSISRRGVGRRQPRSGPGVGTTWGSARSWRITSSPIATRRGLSRPQRYVDHPRGDATELGPGLDVPGLSRLRNGRVDRRLRADPRGERRGRMTSSWGRGSPDCRWRPNCDNTERRSPCSSAVPGGRESPQRIQHEGDGDGVVRSSGAMSGARTDAGDGTHCGSGPHECPRRRSGQHQLVDRRKKSVGGTRLPKVGPRTRLEMIALAAAIRPRREPHFGEACGRVHLGRHRDVGRMDRLHGGRRPVGGPRGPRGRRAARLAMRRWQNPPRLRLRKAALSGWCTGRGKVRSARTKREGGDLAAEPSPLR